MPGDGVRVACGVHAPDELERLLRGLPEWFGIESALAGYVKAAATLPTWTAAVDGEVVAACTARRHFPHAAEIDVLAVRRDLHRRGIGRMLLGRVEADLRASGTGLVSVKTLGPSRPDPGYAATRRFYQSLGYRPVQEHPAGTIWPDNPCLVMVKMLDSDRD